MRTLTSWWSRLFRKHRNPAAEYEAEAMFAGWVDLPPLFRRLLHPH
jgi:hypothetical protein